MNHVQQQQQQVEFQMRYTRRDSMLPVFPVPLAIVSWLQQWDYDLIVLDRWLADQSWTGWALGLAVKHETTWRDPGEVVTGPPHSWPEKPPKLSIPQQDDACTVSERHSSRRLRLVADVFEPEYRKRAR
ncbi:hypothetical protein E4U41_004768 [Claviceps citrina]|nr:hypothetical protein E4U41_004768 [Claviceps citrina]